MCGITGFYLPFPNENSPVHRLARGGLLRHRGPDGFRHWINSAKTVGLQHYRLAIQDLSDAGAQPMVSADGRYVMTFNGEIYNHFELREQLTKEGQNINWRGHSDTETLLTAISLWGVRKSLNLCVGMFAFAIYDLVEGRLTFARDRLGEKPLYYGFISGSLCFSSELKALRAIGRSSLRLNVSILAAYMRLGYVPGNESIYEGVFRLPPGSIFSITPREIAAMQLPGTQSYWNASELSSVSKNIEQLDHASILNGLDVVLRRAVKGQMLSDVSLGALLSGGIDSSLIVAMMQAQSAKPVNTFSIGFEGVVSDEAPFARKIAAHLGTCHTELYLNARDVLDTIPSLPSVFCEPFADSSQVPTLLVSKLAREHVSVALTGDGGDELFGGYSRYFLVNNGYSRISSVPIYVRHVVAKLLYFMPTALVEVAAYLIGKSGKAINYGDRLKKISDVLTSSDPSDLNRRLLTLWNPSVLMPGIKEVESVFTRELPSAPSVVEQMMLADTLCYLPDDLLVKVDRASMASSLECRVPFLDHRVVEYAWKLSLTQKVGRFENKFLLKQLLDRYIPRPLFDRPKQGFGLPVEGWLNGPLRSWAEDLLAPSALSRYGFFNVDVIRKRWDEQLAGSRNWQQHLWTILMFQAWAEDASV